MEYYTLNPRCFSHVEPVHIMWEFFDLLSTYTYHSDGELIWLVFLHDFLTMIHMEDGCSDKHASLLLGCTLRESLHRWLCSIPADNVHSLEKFCDLIEDTFHHFDLEHLDNKLLQQWKAWQQSPMDFWQHLKNAFVAKGFIGLVNERDLFHCTHGCLDLKPM